MRRPEPRSWCAAIMKERPATRPSMWPSKGATSPHRHDRLFRRIGQNGSHARRELCHISRTTGAGPLQKLTDQGRQRIEELAQRYAASADAVMTLLQALVNTNGTMAQFNHSELGGGGQWMQGGMTMVGDTFNSGLKSKVHGLCSELSQLLAQRPFIPRLASFQSRAGGQQQGGSMGAGSVSLFVPQERRCGRASSQWWPADLGFPNGSGAQNHVRYAYFNATRRMAVELNGHGTVYDPLDHQISGVSQQPG